MWRSRTPDGDRCARFPSVITTIMDQKETIAETVEQTWVVCHLAEPFEFIQCLMHISG
jgi:hypothetical protein